MLPPLSRNGRRFIPPQGTSYPPARLPHPNGEVYEAVPMRPAPLVARLLFPKKQPHLPRQHLRQLLWAIAIGIVAAGTIAGIMLWKAGGAVFR